MWRKRLVEAYLTIFTNSLLVWSRRGAVWLARLTGGCGFSRALLALSLLQAIGYADFCRSAASRYCPILLPNASGLLHGLLPIRVGHLVSLVSRGGSALRLRRGQVVADPHSYIGIIPRPSFRQSSPAAFMRLAAPPPVPGVGLALAPQARHPRTVRSPVNTVSFGACVF